ncbi:MAG: GHMP kinase [Methanosarcinales archaeon]|nr:GHMP kinase [Methanosarcinales archaeon]
MIGRAYAPAHITGFFAVKQHQNPIKAGSIGCGLCLEAGVTATITVDPSYIGSVIRFNGKQIGLPTVEYVIKGLLEPGHSQLIIDLESEIPLGFGFGISGAAALASALALNAVFDLHKTVNQVASIAHCAEVVNMTGMGDVAGQCAGGVVMRIKPGAPGTGQIDTIPFSQTEVSWVCLGEVNTVSVLSNEVILNSINRVGSNALKTLLKRPALKNFMSISREFAFQTGLVSSRARDVIEAVEARGQSPAVAMLGDTVFTLGECSVLKEFGQVGLSRIGLSGAYCR